MLNYFSQPILIVIILIALSWPLYWKICRSHQYKQGFMIFLSMAILGILSLNAVTLTYAVNAILLLTLGNIIIFYCGKMLRDNPKPVYIIIAIIIPFSALLFLKLLHPYYPTLSPLAQITIPLGISYFTFKQIHFLIDSSRGHFKNGSLLTFFNYIFFFPMFIAGPIERYQNFSSQAEKIEYNRKNVHVGLERILIGLSQKLIVSDLILSSFLPPATLVEDGILELQWYQIQFAGFIKFLTLYFDFAGYTSIALGTALLFGFKLMENFNFPLLRPTLAEFWRNWHISLSSWARDYVYFPLLIKYRLTSVALICTMLTIGVWHSILPGWLLWGLHHGIGLTLLSYYQKWADRYHLLSQIRTSKLWWFVSLIIVWWYVSLGFILTFRADSLKISLALYLKTISFGLII